MTLRRPLISIALTIGLVLAGSLGTAGALATPAPHPADPAAARLAAKKALPTCVNEDKCTIVKDTNNADRSCTGYSSQTTPPTTIRVLVRTGGQTGTYTIADVPFTQYLQNVLPDEWTASYDLDSLKAGAVAVKSYAWYWVNHFGGYLGSNRSNCFDVTDDQLFQVYLPNSATSRTNAAISATQPYVARMNGNVFQAQYQDNLTGRSDEACGAGADGTMLSQDGSQNCVDSDTSPTGNTGNKFNVILGIYYYPGLQLTTTLQRRTPHDFTFTQTSTRVTFNAGTWSIDDAYHTTFHYGTTGDQPVITDNGDGFAHIGVFRPSTGYWYLASPTGTQASAVPWGSQGDIPVPGHYAGIAAASVVAVYRPSTKTWYIRGRAAVGLGRTGDVPVPGDYNGDGTTEIAVFRPSNGYWYRQDGTATPFGRAGDIPVPADYDGDGKTDIAVYRPSTRQFFVSGKSGVGFGDSGDIPVTGDYTGDGHADFAVYRPSNNTWYVQGQPSQSFGSGGSPIGRAPYRG